MANELTEIEMNNGTLETSPATEFQCINDYPAQWQHSVPKTVWVTALIQAVHRIMVEGGVKTIKRQVFGSYDCMVNSVGAVFIEPMSGMYAMLPPDSYQVVTWHTDISPAVGIGEFA